MHQLFVDGEAARCVEHINIITAHGGLGLGAFGDLDRIFAFDNGQGVNANLHAEDGKLFHGGRAVHVKRRHQHTFAFAVFKSLG